ncbi:hypothetical protein KOR42_23160 [Thalassoglobus neptunius]|uniref:Uncharacterized protein n=1 Tax=Thalassoglobus neptunius TaxID=1938619 RepID=A0A5C5X889_9PLAN|nr:hypothetical protein [Thalassoglobus neptunius]TWT58929.1 hypothetical protein KOR42_23160 [Thalassoglobus neptunius]
MEAGFVVAEGTDISAIEKVFPDLWEDEGYGEGVRSYVCGSSSDEHDSDGSDADGNPEWMSFDECVEFCGFVEGAIPETTAYIEGNGPWAMSMIRRKNFSRYSMTDPEVKEHIQVSNRYWAAFKRGKTAAEKVKTQE